MITCFRRAWWIVICNISRYKWLAILVSYYLKHLLRGDLQLVLLEAHAFVWNWNLYDLNHLRVWLCVWTYDLYYLKHWRTRLCVWACNSYYLKHSREGGETKQTVERTCATPNSCRASELVYVLLEARVSMHMKHQVSTQFV